MSFSQELYPESILRNDRISSREVAYYRQRLKHQVFGRLAAKFAARSQQVGLTKSKLAALSGKDAGQINRLLSFPSNLTLETLSDLALALGCEPEVDLMEFDIDPCHNFVHELMQDREERVIEYNGFIPIALRTGLVVTSLEVKENA